MLASTPRVNVSESRVLRENEGVAPRGNATSTVAITDVRNRLMSASIYQSQLAGIDYGRVFATARLLTTFILGSVVSLFMKPLWM